MKCSLLIFAAFASATFAQKSVAPAPVAPSPGRTSNPNFPTTNNPNSTQQSNTTNNGVLAPRPVYLSGKVIMEDGTPPPELVRIEKVCGGNPRPEGYTDSKGRFSFQLDGGLDVMSDASDSNFGRAGTPSGSTSTSRRTSNLNGCDLRASLPGFRSSAVSLSLHDSLDNPNVGSIVLHRMGNVEGTTISMTSLNAPKDAQKSFLKGREAFRKEKPVEAEKDFQKAVDEYPKYAAAWYELGRAQVANNRPAEARKSFQESIAADPKLVTPYLELALVQAKAREWQQTVETTNQAIKLNPVDFPQLYFYNAIANLNLQNLDAAAKSALEAQKLDTQHQIAQLGKLIQTIESAKKPVAETDKQAPRQ